MEQALYISKAAHLKYWTTDFTRLYFGMEFCERLLPSPAQLKRALTFAGDNTLAFTLVTPYVTETGLKKVEKLVDTLCTIQPESEIIFNDWGIFHLLREKHYPVKPVLGRMLNKLKRGPRIVPVRDKIPATSLDYFMTPNISIPEVRSFLLDRGIARVECDNLLQGLDLDDIGNELHISLYLPFAYVTTSRFCLMPAIRGPAEMKIGVLPCKKECQQYAFSLWNPVMTVPLIRKGNSIFFSNEEIPDQLLREGKIDRIVVEPEIPI
jgi:hypothetical protein